MAVRRFRAAAAFLVAAAVCNARPLDPLPDQRDHDLIGWQGEQNRGMPVPTTNNQMRLEFISWTNPYIATHPETRIILVHGFMTDEECDHIIAVSKGQMERSSVVDSETTEGKVDQIRTSTGTFLAPGFDPIVSAIEHRLAQLVMLPVENQEAMQVLHYAVGEKYGAHMDAFSDPRLTKPETGGERIATSLSFLSTPEFGGETVFPNMPGDNEGPEWSPCARKGLAVHPKKGSMVLFWNLFPNGTVDMMATHAACPVVRGEKWSAPKWLHQGNFQHEHRTAPLFDLGGACVDLDVNCRDWAAKGECEKNIGFMKGSDSSLGRCRESCSVCPYPKIQGLGGAQAPVPKEKAMTESIVRGGEEEAADSRGR